MSLDCGHYDGFGYALPFLIGNIWQGVFSSSPLSYLAKIFVFFLKAPLFIKINIDINNIFYIISSIIISFDLLFCDDEDEIESFCGVRKNRFLL